MKTVQEVLHTIEVGKGRYFIQGALFIVGFAFIGFMVYWFQFRGLSHPEAFDSAQLARRVAEGRPLTTGYIRPAALAQLRDEGFTGSVHEVPETHRAPLYPLIVGSVLKYVPLNEPVKTTVANGAYGPERIIVLVNEIFLLLTALALYFWLARMFDRRVAVLGTLVLIVCDLIWQITVSGLTTPLAMLLVTLSCGTLHEAFRSEDEGRTAGTWFFGIASGIFLGLAGLTNLALMWLLPAFLITIFVGLRNRPLAAVTAVLAAVVVVSPWYIRNYLLTNNPFGFSLLTIVGDVPLIERRFASSWPPIRGVGSRLVTGFGFSIANFFTLMGGTLAVAFFVASILHPYRRRRAQLMLGFTVLGVISLMIGGAFLTAEPATVSDLNLLPVLWPAVGAFGAAFFYIMLDRLNVGLVILRYIVITVFVFICGLPLLLTLAPPSEPAYRYPPYFPPMLRSVGDVFEPQDLLASDIPWAMSWYTGRTSVNVPATVDDFFSINDSVANFRGMLLTPETWRKPLYELDKGSYKDWGKLIRREGLPPGFPLFKLTVLPPLDNEYLLLTDRPPAFRVQKQESEEANK